MTRSRTPGDDLDPADWDEFRALGHRMIDELVDFLRDTRDGPVWRPVPDAVKERLREGAPDEGQPLGAVWDDARELILPYRAGNIHPRFWGWVGGSGTPSGMLADLVASAMNSNVGGRDHGAVYVERQVIDWARRIFGFPDGATGILLTGTSMATLTGLAVARGALAGFDVRKKGLAGGPPLVAYASYEAHVSVRKALEVLGHGADSVRVVPADEHLRMDVRALREMIPADRARGLHPFCVIGTAGTVNTGAMDDLRAIADVCAEEKLWMHVDGAFGAFARIAPARAHLVEGIERADSLAFDFHKWLHVPYAVGCLLVRDGERHRATFATTQSYLSTHRRGLAAGSPWFSDFGPDLSRGFSALRVWFTVRTHGLAKLGAMVEKNCRQAELLADLVRAEPRLELRAPVSLNVVCFRWAPPGADPATLGAVNDEIVYELHERGIAAPSTTKLGGEVAIRACITNHRTRDEDLHVLVAAACEIGERLAARSPAVAAPA